MKRRKKTVIRLKIREIAESKKINMSKLSRMADVNYNTIRGIWDNPNRDIAVTTLEKIAKALGANVSDLYEIVPDQNEQE